MDRRLKKEKFEWLRMLELEKVHVCETLQFWSDIEVSAGVGQKNSGIDEICLALLFVGAKGRDEASGSGEKDAGSRESNCRAIPEAEDAPGKRRQINDRVETSGVRIARIGVAGSIKGGDTIADP